MCCGGSASFSGFNERLKQEMIGANPEPMSIKVVNVTDKKENFVWIGGSILSSLTTFEQMWISLAEYE